MKRTTTTVREYDENGRCVKETTTTISDDYTPPVYRPLCTCGRSTACPVHPWGWWQSPYIVTCGTNTFAAPVTTNASLS